MKDFSNNDYVDTIIEHFDELSFLIEDDYKSKQKSISIDFDNIKNTYKYKIKYIDLFPKIMEMNSAHRILDIFYDKTHDKNEYLNQEIKFLRTILLILAYSKNIILETDYVFYKNTSAYAYINEAIEKEDVDNLRDINSFVFAVNDIEESDSTIGYHILESLLKLCLRERIRTTVFLIDLNIAIEIQGLYLVVYSKNDALGFVEKICITEGLYLR